MFREMWRHDEAPNLGDDYYRYRKIEDLELRRKEGNAPRLGVQMPLRSPVGGHVTLGDIVYVA